MALAASRGQVDYLRPDGKSQVTVEYDADGRPCPGGYGGHLHPASPEITHEQIRRQMIEQVIKPVIPAGPAGRRTQV